MSDKIIRPENPPLNRAKALHLAGKVERGEVGTDRNQRHRDIAARVLREHAHRD